MSFSRKWRICSILLYANSDRIKKFIDDEKFAILLRIVQIWFRNALKGIL